MSVIYGIIQILPNNQWKQFMDGLFGNGITRVSSWDITRSLLVPVMLGTILAISIPGIMAWGCVQLLGKSSSYIYIIIVIIIIKFVNDNDRTIYLFIYSYFVFDFLFIFLIMIYR